MEGTLNPEEEGEEVEVPGPGSLRNVRPVTASEREQEETPGAPIVRAGSLGTGGYRERAPTFLQSSAAVPRTLSTNRIPREQKRSVFWETSGGSWYPESSRRAGSRMISYLREVSPHPTTLDPNPYVLLSQDPTYSPP